jgi:hypothetical protein
MKNYKEKKEEVERARKSPHKRENINIPRAEREADHFRDSSVGGGGRKFLLVLIHLLLLLCECTEARHGHHGYDLNYFQFPR